MLKKIEIIVYSKLDIPQKRKLKEEDGSFLNRLAFDQHYLGGFGEWFLMEQT